MMKLNIFARNIITLKYSLIYIFFAFLLVTTSCKTKQVATKDTTTSRTAFAFNFIESSNLSDILDKAAISNKLVFLDVSASWCAPCQLMKRDVYTHQATATFFNNNFVNYLIDVEKGEGPDIKVIYNVTVYPTLLILDSKGREILRKEGGTYHESLINFGKEGIKLGAN